MWCCPNCDWNLGSVRFDDRVAVLVGWNFFFQRKFRSLMISRTTFTSQKNLKRILSFLNNSKSYWQFMKVFTSLYKIGEHEGGGGCCRRNKKWKTDRNILGSSRVLALWVPDLIALHVHFLSVAKVIAATRAPRARRMELVAARLKLGNSINR